MERHARRYLFGFATATLLAGLARLFFSALPGLASARMLLFRRGAAADSFAGLERQLTRLEAKPGVRQQP
jgi:hypothetical protein